MIPQTNNKRRQFALILSTAVALIGFFYTIILSHAQIESTRPQTGGDSGLGFTGASTSNDLVIFDMATSTANPTTISLLPEGSYPFDATISPDGNQLWIAGAVGDGLIVVNAVSPAIVQRIQGIGDWPSDIAFSEHGQLAYVSIREDAQIQVVDSNTYNVVDTISLADPLQDLGKMRLNHCTGELYAVSYFDFHFYVIDPIAHDITQINFGSSLWDLTIDPTATTLYIADRGIPDAVHVFDIATLTTTTSIPVGTDPWGIDITPDGRYVLTANEDSHDVSVIDTATNSVITTTFLAANADPRDIDINAEGTLAYVTSGDIGSPDGIYVIDLITFQVVDTIFSPTGGGSNTNVIAVAPDFASLDPIASFTSTAPVQIGAPIQFFDTTANNPTTWFWDFGDGLGDSAEQNPTYNYANPGTYTITLTTANACGTDSIQGQVTVINPAPNLTIHKTAPATADPHTPITYTLTVTNSGLGLATNLLITDVLPVGASYVNGGTLINSTVHWQVPSLAVGTSIAVQLIVTATTTITNSDYAVTADGGFSAVGSQPVTTIIKSPVHHLYLPFIKKE